MNVNTRIQAWVHAAMLFSACTRDAQPQRAEPDKPRSEGSSTEPGSARVPQASKPPADVATTQPPLALPGVPLRPRTFTSKLSPDVTSTWWIESGREDGVNTSDPCCDISYDGDQYNDAIATCGKGSRFRSDGGGCPAGYWKVSPGLADDRVCPKHPRCVVLPRVRVISLDGSTARVSDGEYDNTFPVGGVESAKLVPVHVTREGAYVYVEGSAGVDAIAVDHGRTYAIYLENGRLKAVMRDLP
jgi:hypothetical protein